MWLTPTFSPSLPPCSPHCIVTHCSVPAVFLVQGWDTEPGFQERQLARRDAIEKEGVKAPWRASVRDAFR